MWLIEKMRRWICYSTQSNAAIAESVDETPLRCEKEARMDARKLVADRREHQKGKVSVFSANG
jgi:hypothetical protein